MPNDKKIVSKNNKTNETNMVFGKMNYLLLAAGFLVIVIGYILMSGGGSSDPSVFNGEELFSARRLVVAPIIILLGFVFEIYAIMYRPKAKNTEKSEEK